MKPHLTIKLLLSYIFSFSICRYFLTSTLPCEKHPYLLEMSLVVDAAHSVPARNQLQSRAQRENGSFPTGVLGQYRFCPFRWLMSEELQCNLMLSYIAT